MAGKSIYTTVFVTVLISSVCFLAQCSAIGGTQQKRENPAKLSAAARINLEIQDLLKKNNDAYIYFFAKSYKKSALESDRIRKLAKKEKTGFVMVDVDKPALKVLMNGYGIAFVPTVIHLRRGLGIVENFSGTSAVKRLKKGRKPYKQYKHFKRITENAGRGNVTLLEFYAEWCSPCIEQMPLIETASEMSDGQLDVIRIYVDNEAGMTALYNVDSPPTNIVIDKNGVLRLRTSMISSAARLLETLENMELL